MDKTGRLNYIESGIDDMTNLVELSDESLLYNLQTRYSQKIIYTYIGSILISINPYTELNIYDKKSIARYQNKSMQEVPPHLFGIAEINYSKMMLENENQVIVISGESGAGKTESFKRILRYLAYTSGSGKGGNSSDKDLSGDVANKILDSTPLLESFGNAKTIRNDNSSRFGKYVEIFFENGSISGSRTTNYLLEKSRIVNISPDERGYHIFYELLQGLDSYGKSQYYLKNVADYAYLNNAKNFSVAGRDDGAHLKEFMSQWSTLGLTNEDLDVAIRIISAVLHLGNIKFKDEDDASYMLETENVNVVAKMLKVDSASLIGCLTMKTTDTVKDTATSPVNAEQAANLRDTLAKHLYSELFDWIVTKVNESLNQKSSTVKRSSSHLDRSLNGPSSSLRCIAMLDIYGFENFPENSLEQLCINYANETLQQFFNRYVFELEQAEYKQEGISWHYVTYPDNQPIINLLSARPSGIIQILNDECSIPQGSDEAFLTKCHNVHQKNANFEKPKKVHPPQFIIRHFAGDIYYTVTGFLEKNRDIIRKEAIFLVEHCGVKEIANMFMRKREKTTKSPTSKARTPAVMADFQNSLTTLLTKMKTCQPWFIRCLKPNNNKQALTFNKDIVMDQMRYTGILETVKIRKSGFPIRIVFSLFLSRFYLLQSKEMRRFAKKDPQEACLKMLPKFKGQRGKDFEVGKSKLFLKENFARFLETQVRVIRERSAIKIQRKWRAYWKIRAIIVKNKAATKIQAVVRGFLDRRRIKRLRIAIVKLQAFVRMQLVRQKFVEKHPQFLKYNIIKVEKTVTTKSTAMSYQFPEMEVGLKNKRRRDKKSLPKFNYNLLKIPMKLAYLLDKSTDNYGKGHEIPSHESIMQTCRAQHLYNRDDYQLPDDINDYRLEDYLEEFGNNISLESKNRPIPIPYLKENMSSTLKDDSLNAHKLLLRLLYADSMPWFHRYISGSFLSFMASTSPQMQTEILVQVITETLYTRTDGLTAGKNHFVSDQDSRRLSAAWTVLGNLLSHIIPVPEIFNYVLKHVSDSFGIDQACTCQEKLLQFVGGGGTQCQKIPRLFPASNLEWRANSRGSKTSLIVRHPDGVSNSVHVNSFTTAENFANHSICFRLKRFRVNNGWSISIVTSDGIIDCSGHNYVFDVIAGLELTSHWADIVGYGLEHKFLISRQGSKPTSDNSDFMKPKPLKPYPKESLNKSIATISSRKSMDSWVVNNFDSSFEPEGGASVRVHDFIHGLEDELKNQGNGNASNNAPVFPVVNQSIMGMPGMMTPQPMYQYAPAPFSGPYPTNYYYPTTSDRRYLEDTLNSVELENKVIQSSIDKELLQKRLKELRQESSGQIQYPAYGYPMQPPMMYPMPMNSTMMPGQFMPQPGFQMPYMPINYGNNYMQGPLSHVNNNSESSKSDDANVNKATKSVQTKRKAPRPPIEDYDDASSVDGLANDELKQGSAKSKDNNRVKIRRPQPMNNENMTLSQLRASEIPTSDITDRAEFLNKFFKEKKAQNPQTKTKRPAPQPPTSTESPPPPTSAPPPPPPPPPKYEGHVPAPPPLIPQPQLIPRPSIKPGNNVLKSIAEKMSHDDDDIVKDKDIKETLAKLNESFNSVNRTAPIIPPQIKKRSKRKMSSSKKAIILSGLPDIRYYTYTNLPWFPLVKIELFLPKEIQDSTILKPVIFCQIVRDLLEFPCARWIGSERRELLILLGNVRDVFDIESLLATPSGTILNVIDRAQNCELYFSRFYSIQWISTNASGHVCHWLAISHTGIRFVEDNLKSRDVGLNIVNRILYSDLRSVSCKNPDLYGNPQRIVIMTKSNKVYEMTCTHAQSAVNLIKEFIGDQSDTNKNELENSTNGLPTDLFKHKKTKRRQLEDVQYLAGPSTLGVNNKRIPLKSLMDTVGSSLNDRRGPTVGPDGDLIDFMLIRSNKRSRTEIENILLKWERYEINEPLLPSMNSKMTKKAIELYHYILAVSGDMPIKANTSVIDCGMAVFKTIYHNRDLLEEIIMQIMKQIDGNPRQINRQQLWSLLSTLLLFFGVTRRMEPYLLEHLKRMLGNNATPDSDCVTRAANILRNTSTFGPRKEMPVENELKHLLSGVRDASIMIHLPRDSREFRVPFHSTVDQVITNICDGLEITVHQDRVEYSLAIVEVDEHNIPIGIADGLKTDSYLFDSLNILAKEGKSNFIFYFSRCSWIFPIKPEQCSPTLVNLLFNQLSQDVISGNWMLGPTNDSRLLKLMTAIAYFNLKGQGFEKPITDEMLQTILPRHLLASQSPSKQELISMIYATPSVINITKMTKQIEFQRKFIELVSQLPRYGWISLPIVRLSHVPATTNLSINFTPENISIVNEDRSDIILKITLASLTSFQVTKVDSRSSQFTVRYSGIQEIQFVTTMVPETVILLNQYQTIKNMIPTRRL